jgi:hypothetical protein
MTMAAPTLRQGALVTIVGYLLTFGTPFASFSALPKLIVNGLGWMLLEAGPYLSGRS